MDTDASGSADAAGTGLEELMLTVLRSGGPAGKGLRDKVSELIRWTSGDFDDDDLRLMNALHVRLCELRLRSLPPAAAAEPPARPAPANFPPSESAEPAGESGEVSEPAGDATPDYDPGLPVSVPEPNPERIACDRLLKLWETTAANVEAGRYLDRYSLETELDDSDRAEWLWLRLRQALLRVPGDLAREVAGQAEIAIGEIGGRPTILQRHASEFPDVQALADELAGRGNADWADLPETIATLHWLAWHDTAVKIAYYEVVSQGIKEFTGEYRASYHHLLTGRLHDLAKTEPGSAEEIDQLVKLDAILRGIVPTPLPAKNSWWLGALDSCAHLLEFHPAAQNRVKVFPIDIERGDEWEKMFGKAVGVIEAADTAEGGGRPGDQAWILRYPHPRPNLKENGGRYLAIK